MLYVAAPKCLTAYWDNKHTDLEPFWCRGEDAPRVLADHVADWLESRGLPRRFVKLYRIEPFE